MGVGIAAFLSGCWLGKNTIDSFADERFSLRDPKGDAFLKLTLPVRVRYTFSPLLCRSGEIGRHARFRSVCQQWHGGSSPLSGTIQTLTGWSLTKVTSPFCANVELLVFRSPPVKDSMRAASAKL